MKNKIRKQRLLQMLGILCFIGGWIFLIAGAMFQSTGRESNITINLVGFFGFLIMAVILLLLSFGTENSIRRQKQMEQYKAQPLTIIPNLDRDRMDRAFQTAGFALRNGIWSKKQLSEQKPRYRNYYYARYVSRDDDMKWLSILKKQKTTSKMCVFIFFCYEMVTPEDEMFLRKQVAKTIQEEVNAWNSPQPILTSIPILVDNTAGEGRFMEFPQGVTVYSQGCALLKELFA